MTDVLARGPVMADVHAYCLSDEEKQRLLDPAIGGVILFRRNFQNVAQLKALVAEIKALRQPELVVAVDHEGGRVQRFIEGFTRLPAMNVLGEIWDTQGAEEAKRQATQVGWVLATELSACGIDLSFTPVLDLNWGQCAVIGNRSFHCDAQVVSELALALQQGLQQGGMKSCGKHFPGHGFVEGDSHHVLPEDTRDFDALWQHDMVPFVHMSAAGMGAVMPAHVVYPQVDAQPAGFSAFWLKNILRDKIGFDGIIFSDDLTMEGACGVGGITVRTELSLQAGCDIALICNRPDLVDELLSEWTWDASTQPKLAERWARVAGQGLQADFEALLQTEAFQQAQQRVAVLATPKDVHNGVKVGEAY